MDGLGRRRPGSATQGIDQDRQDRLIAEGAGRERARLSVFYGVDPVTRGATGGESLAADFEKFLKEKYLEIRGEPIP